jgi:H+/Cl- antiporter ClcA
MRNFVAAVVGGLLGFAMGSMINHLLNPVLEESSGLLREMQGLLWNLVPMLTLVGVALGVWVVRRHQRNR